MFEVHEARVPQGRRVGIVTGSFFAFMPPRLLYNKIRGRRFVVFIGWRHARRVLLGNKRGGTVNNVVHVN